MNAFVFRHPHLGDKVVSCLALQSMADQMGSKVKVGGCEVARNLIECFKLDMLEWTEKAKPTGRKLRLTDIFDFLYKTKVTFFTSPFFAIDFELPKVERLWLPRLMEPKAEVTLFQFDSRSSSESKRKLSRMESMYFIKKKARFRPVGVGGIDTNRELPFDYDLGSLSHIIKRIKSAAQFVGVDSGISHIAGAFGVPSEIYLMHTERHNALMVERFYKECYPNITCTHDFSNVGGRVLRLKIF